MADLHDLLTRNDLTEDPYWGRSSDRDDNEEEMHRLKFEDWYKGGRMNKFWIIFVEHTDGGRHYRHSTLGAAQIEAERLARLPENQGLYVFIFECVGKCKTEIPPVKWEVPR